MLFLTRFWWLLCAHALTDYVLQTERMATLKRPMKNSKGCVGEYGPWWWWMSAHALINGLGVTYVTQNPLLGVGEASVHFTLDWLKCQGCISVYQDQVGHLFSKVVWAIL